MKTKSPFLIKNQNVGKSPIFIIFRDFRVVVTFVKKYDRFLSVSCLSVSYRTTVNLLPPGHMTPRDHHTVKKLQKN